MSDETLNAIIETCLPYLTNGFKFADYQIPVFSPYVGSGTTTESFMSDLNRQQREEKHREIVKKYISEK